jgi:hypothetical protein
VGDYDDVCPTTDALITMMTALWTQIEYDDECTMKDLASMMMHALWTQRRV